VLAVKNVPPVNSAQTANVFSTALMVKPNVVPHASIPRSISITVEAVALNALVVKSVPTVNVSVLLVLPIALAFVVTSPMT
jgi:hypothetical protein